MDAGLFCTRKVSIYPGRGGKVLLTDIVDDPPCILVPFREEDGVWRTDPIGFDVEGLENDSSVALVNARLQLFPGWELECPGAVAREPAERATSSCLDDIPRSENGLFELSLRTTDAPPSDTPAEGTMGVRLPLEFHRGADVLYQLVRIKVCSEEARAGHLRELEHPVAERLRQADLLHRELADYRAHDARIRRMLQRGEAPTARQCEFTFGYLK